MRKWIFVVSLSVCASFSYAQKAADSAQTAPQQTAEAVAAAPAVPALTPEEQYERFQERNKEIRRLTKLYRKAKTEEKKTEIKARLLQIVSEATDEGIVWAKERIAAERANLDQWEKNLQEQEADLDQLKARRVDDILSGEAERRHKLAQKRWKQEMKDRKKYMK